MFRAVFRHGPGCVAVAGPVIATMIDERRYRHRDVRDWFRYDVVRIWEQPVEEVLASASASWSD